MIALILTLGCEPGEGKGSSESGYEVDCLGMSPGEALAGYRIMTTRGWGRCVGLIGDTLTGAPVGILQPEELGVNTVDVMSLQIQYGEDLWVSRSGEVVFDVLEGASFAQGRYDVVATNDAGEEAHITGAIDWCAFGERQDCPYTSQGGLSKRVEFLTPDNYSSRVDTYATDCRVLTDPATGGIQVDLELGVFNGVNVALWADQCEVTSLLPNHFRFQAGSYEGPGTYGPYETADGLPNVELSLPLVWYGYACLYYFDALSVYSEVGTSCTWTVEEGAPGRFELDCDGAFQRTLRTDALATEGGLHLEADCDVRER